MKRALRLLGIVAPVLGLLAPAGSARADEAQDAQEARAQFALGKEAYAQKRYVDAGQRFEAAAALRPHPVALLTAALAWDAAGKLDRAADAFARCVDMPGLDAKQAQTARDRLTQLEKTLGTLVVSANASSKDTPIKVQLEGASEWTLPARLHGASGPHLLLIRPGTATASRKEIALEAGQTSVFVVEPEPATPEPVAQRTHPEPANSAGNTSVSRTSPTSEGLSTRQAIGLPLMGAGALGLGAGVVLGLEALSARDAYNAAPSRAGFDHAGSLATWTTVSFIAGGVLAAGGATLFLWPKSAERQSTAWISSDGTQIAFGLRR